MSRSGSHELTHIVGASVDFFYDWTGWDVYALVHTDNGTILVPDQSPHSAAFTRRVFEAAWAAHSICTVARTRFINVRHVERDGGAVLSTKTVDIDMAGTRWCDLVVDAAIELIGIHRFAETVAGDTCKCGEGRDSIVHEVTS